jgi:signal transduction histidine kinase
MRERAEALHGTLRIVASPGGGTRVEVTLPAAQEVGA